MRIEKTVLGKPFADNALYVRLNSGQKIHRFLFDCGEGTCNELSIGELQKIDHLFFSHFHLDHIAGFDHFIRANYNRTTKPVHIWGPKTTTEIIFHRLNSFTWNLIDDVPSWWIIHEITPQKILTTELRASEAFAQKHPVGVRDFNSTILETADYRLSIRFLEHRIKVLGFKLQEKARLNISKAALIRNSLPEGHYLEKLKDPKVNDDQQLKVGDQIFTVGHLRKLLLEEQPGECLAYLTDFIFQESRLKEWADWLNGCDELVCESQYLSNDRELAGENFHLTTDQAAKLAKEAKVKSLTLIHFSRRYQNEKPDLFLEEANKIFPASHLPEGWNS